jgi:hypothetical protein
MEIYMTLGLRFRSRRMGIASIFGALLVASATLSIVVVHGTTHAQVVNRPFNIHSARVQPRVLANGTVDVTKLPRQTAGTMATPRTLNVNRPRLSKSQRAAYNKRAAHSSGAPSQAIGDSPNFVGNSILPPVYQNFEGLAYPQGYWYPPDQAIAANTSYVLEGVNNAIAVYNTTGKLLYGPYSADAFFGPVELNGDHVTDPEITYDATRANWVITYLEITPNGTGGVAHGYIDIAVSKGLSPTEPSPGLNYYIYQIDANNGQGTGNNCDCDTLGMDYWGLWVLAALRESPECLRITQDADERRLHGMVEHFGKAVHPFACGIGWSAPLALVLVDSGAVRIVVAVGEGAGFHPRSADRAIRAESAAAGHSGMQQR